MATSGTAVWTPDFTELIEEACERAGFEIRTGYQFRSARRSLNILFSEWANRGINLWTVEQGSLTLTPSTASFNLPDDTVDLIEHVVRTNAGNATTQTDLVISRIALPTYSAIPNKLATGRPVQIYIDRQSPTPAVKVWPTADNSAVYTLVYWRLRRVQDAGQAGSNTADVPFRFIPALIAGLAYHMAMKTPESANRVEGLKAAYDEAFFLASLEDRDKSSVRFVPDTCRF